MKTNFRLEKKVFFVLKVINLIILGIAVIFILGSLGDGMDGSNKGYEVSLNLVFVTLLISPYLAYLIVEGTKPKYVFCEWDKEERRKRDSFISKLCLFVFFFTYFSVFTLLSSIIEIYKSPCNFDKILIVAIFYGIVFLLNAIYTVKLHNSLYVKDLIQHVYKKKPEGWQE